MTFPFPHIVTGGSAMALEFVGEVYGTGASVPLPDGAQEGDLAFFIDGAVGATAAPSIGAVPSGWERIAALTNGSFGSVAAQQCYRLLGASPPASVSSSFGSTSARRSRTLLFRPSKPITNISLEHETHTGGAGSLSIGPASGTSVSVTSYIGGNNNTPTVTAVPDFDGYYSANRNAVGFHITAGEQITCTFPAGGLGQAGILSYLEVS